MQVAAPSLAVAVDLGNLVGNAFGYTPAGCVDVRIAAHCVQIADTGPGAGAGLGLAILRGLRELYDGRVSLTVEAGGA